MRPHGLPVAVTALAFGILLGLGPLGPFGFIAGYAAITVGAHRVLGIDHRHTHYGVLVIALAVLWMLPPLRRALAPMLRELAGRQTATA
jgi:hypothetical protein